MDPNEYRELREWDALRQIERNTRPRVPYQGPGRPLGCIGRAFLILTALVVLVMLIPAIAAGIHYVTSGGM